MGNFFIVPESIVEKLGNWISADNSMLIPLFADSKELAQEMQNQAGARRIT
jgi:hypothetical protein